jgi:hypothetical protein
MFHRHCLVRCSGLTTAINPFLLHFAYQKPTNLFHASVKQRTTLGGPKKITFVDLKSSFQSALWQVD